jgi:hypothetical protein
MLAPLLIVFACGSVSFAQSHADSTAFVDARAYMTAIETMTMKIACGTSIGTAFLVQLPDRPSCRFVVTAGHIIRDNTSAKLITQVRGHADSLYVVEFTFTIRVQSSPTSLKTGTTRLWQEYDVAAVVLETADLLKAVPAEVIVFGSLKRSMFASWGDIVPGQSIVYLGFPLGKSAQGFRPLVRTGAVAASEPDSGLIYADAEFFDGSSGSPVFLDSRDAAGRLPVAAGRIFLGMVLGYQPYQKLLLNAKTQVVEMVQTENSGIGLILAGDRIGKLLDDLVRK